MNEHLNTGSRNILNISGEHLRISLRRALALKLTSTTAKESENPKRNGCHDHDYAKADGACRTVERESNGIPPVRGDLARLPTEV